RRAPRPRPEGCRQRRGRGSCRTARAGRADPAQPGQGRPRPDPQPAAEGNGQRPGGVARGAAGRPLRFWDTSALLPLIVDEPSTARLQAALYADPEQTVWWAAEVEAVSAVARGERRGQVDPETATEALQCGGAEVHDEWIDLLDRERLRRAIRGCDAVLHVAALYSYDASEADLERVNVEGTRVVVELCRELGVGRLVHTSSAGTCGPVRGRAATESDKPPSWELAVPYKRTKLDAERIVVAAAREGLDAVIVNPTTPVG